MHASHLGTYAYGVQISTMATAIILGVKDIITGHHSRKAMFKATFMPRNCPRRMTTKWAERIDETMHHVIIQLRFVHVEIPAVVFALPGGDG